ncbi:MAG: OmpA family protein [Thermodesulfovibrionales bacterium]|nr:OmpA family protein [Thermodesulfovibrionales bacterium]
MKRKFKDMHTDNPDRWVISYADFITLMFAFFTALYAISQVDLWKLERFSTSLKDAFKAEETPKVQPTTTIIEGIKPIYIGDIQLQRSVQDILNKAGFVEGITITSSTKGVNISLSDFTIFDKGSAKIKEEAKPLLSLVAEIIKNTNHHIVVEGHTDNIPIRSSTYSSNWELSTARASAVIVYFINDHKIPPERFSAAGYGEYKPVASNSTAEGRNKNRRVDILFLSMSNIKS